MKNRMIAMLLVLVICCSFAPVAYGETQEVQTVYVTFDEKVVALSLLYHQSQWYGKAEDLGTLVDCSVQFVQQENLLRFYRSDSSIVLWEMDGDKAYMEEGDRYVPLVETTCRLGVCFEREGDGLLVTVQRTPADFMVLLQSILQKPAFSTLTLTELPMWDAVETTAKIYAIVSSWTTSSFVSAVIGQDEEQHYQQAMAEILTNDGFIFETLYDIAESKSTSEKWQEIIDFLSILCELNEVEEMQEFLQTQNVSLDALDMEPLEEAAEQGLNLFAFMALAGDMEASCEGAMEQVLANCDNESVRRVAGQTLYQKALRDKSLFITENHGLRYMGYFADCWLEVLEDLADGENVRALAENNFIRDAEALGIEQVDEENFILYAPVYAAVQRELASYCLLHGGNFSQENMEILRGCGLAYLKMALAAYGHLGEKALQIPAVENLLEELQTALFLLMTYEEEEYAPAYTNEVLADWLNENYAIEQTDNRIDETIGGAKAPWATAAQLLQSHTYWYWQTGYTLGSMYAVELRADGTAYGKNLQTAFADSSDVDEKLEWSYEGGVLTFAGETYHWEGNGFTSDAVHEMQTGAYSFVLYPNDSAVEYFVNEISRQEPAAAPTATPTPATTTNPTDKPAITPTPVQEVDVRVGEIYTFGTYEQDNNLNNGMEEIEWIVLDKSDGYVLLLSRYALDCVPYHNLNTGITWENCSLRKWLNGTFINTAFSTEEQKYIRETIVSPERNPSYRNTNPGNQTTDKAFLLSYSEANSYFINNDARMCQATAYAQANGAYVAGNGNCWWWLRTQGDDTNAAMAVFAFGNFHEPGHDVSAPRDAVRPAIWVRTEALATVKTVAKPTARPTEKTTSKPTTDIKVGQYVTFGTYEQDNNFANGQEPIEWLVLDKQDGEVLLLSKYGLDNKYYNNAQKNVTWEACTLRQWLNDEFLDSAFTAREREYIVITSVSNDKSQGYYSTSGGHDTNDKVFLLSYEEANRYLGVTYDNSENEKARVVPSKYALAQGAWINESYVSKEGEKAGVWWLRSPGASGKSASLVDSGGALRYYDVKYVKECVRPAIWVNMDALGQEN